MNRYIEVAGLFLFFCIIILFLYFIISLDYFWTGVIALLIGFILLLALSRKI